MNKNAVLKYNNSQYFNGFEYVCNHEWKILDKYDSTYNILGIIKNKCVVYVLQCKNCGTIKKRVL